MMTICLRRRPSLPRPPGRRAPFFETEGALFKTHAGVKGLIKAYAMNEVHSERRVCGKT
jgi:hypothetical protein